MHTIPLPAAAVAAFALIVDLNLNKKRKFAKKKLKTFTADRHFFVLFFSFLQYVCNFFYLMRHRTTDMSANNRTNFYFMHWAHQRDVCRTLDRQWRSTKQFFFCISNHFVDKLLSFNINFLYTCTLLLCAKKNGFLTLLQLNSCRWPIIPTVKWDTLYFASSSWTNLFLSNY